MSLLLRAQGLPRGLQEGERVYALSGDEINGGLCPPPSFW